MKALPFLGALLLLATMPAASRAQKFHYPTPPAADFAVRKAVPYMRSDSGNVVLDFYRPAKQTAEKLPVLIFLNGLAARSMREAPIYQGWASAATARGIAAINPDAAADFGAGLDSLLAYVRAHAAELGVDPERIAVYAASGNVYGTHAAIQDPKRTAIKAVILYYGAAPIVPLRQDLPLLVVRAGLDRPGLNRDLDSLVAAGVRENAPLRLINYAGGHHAFEIFDDSDATRDVIDQTFDFVTRATRPSYHAALREGAREARAAGALLAGDAAAAAAIYETLVAERPADTRLRLSYGEALLAADRAPEARAQFEQLKDKGLGPRDLGLPAARAALAAGDPAGAVAWLKTIPQRFLPKDLATDPAFAALRQREDFRQLLP